mmetsp:Transcript_27143/g.34638  ORF Transcript_27143/g.34638 Transcript_27143/m.34638 type:complete len:146 (-) Transcript_27143:341-778(-)
MGRWRRRKTNNTIENNEVLKDDDNSTTTDTNNNDSRPNSFYESQPSSEATTQAESYVKSIYKAKKRKKQQQATFNSFDREYIRDYLSLYRSQVLISHLSKEDEEESSGEAVRIAGLKEQNSFACMHVHCCATDTFFSLAQQKHRR